MQRTLYTALLCILCLTAAARNTFSDAVSLWQQLRYTGEPNTPEGMRQYQKYLFQATDFSGVAFVLSGYKKSNTPLRTCTDVANAYRNNPFIGMYMPKDAGNEEIMPLVGSAFPLMDKLNVTNAADGLAKFLIKRGKEELGVAFFERMKKVLNAYPECKALYPNTTDFLNRIETYRYAEMLQSLQECFRKDISALYVNINQVLNLPKYRQLMEQVPEIRLSLRMAATIGELTQSDNTVMPDKVIAHLQKLASMHDMDPNLANAIELEVILSAAFENEGPGSNKWITRVKMNEMMNNEVLLRVFLGLLYEQVSNISFQAGNITMPMQQYLADNERNIQGLGMMLENFTHLANETDAALYTLHNENNMHNPEDVYKYLDKCISLFEYGFSLADIVLPGTGNTPYIMMARNANSLYKNIYTQKYSSAVMNACTLLDMILYKYQPLAEARAERLRKLKQPVDSVLQNLYTAKIPAINGKAVNAALKYGNFMAAVIKSESSDDVQMAIEAAAMPAGSYSVKQKAALNLALNAYVGYCWDFKNTGLLMRGVYAPVGFTLSRALFKKAGGAAGIFVSLIDIGGIVSYRLENGTTDALKQEIRLESIFSPSAQLVLSVPKLPLAVAAGWRMTPKLFYKNNTGFVTVVPEHVLNVGVLIDIPLANMVNVPLP